MLTAARQYHEERYNKKMEDLKKVPKFPELEVGDWVFHHLPGDHPSLKKSKHAPTVKGPFRVIECQEGSSTIKVHDSGFRDVQGEAVRVLPLRETTMAGVEPEELFAAVDGTWEIEEVVKVNTKGPRRGWLAWVKWKGYPTITQEPFAKVQGTEAYAAFMQKRAIPTRQSRRVSGRRQ